MRVDCPICDTPFDAIKAARQRRDICPGCDATWTQMHRAVNPQPEPEHAEITYPIDGHAEVQEQ